MKVDLGILIGLIFLTVSCGEPQINPPPALQLVYLPLKGAIDVELDVEIQIYFSDDVDPDSISQYTILLELADVNRNQDDIQCDSIWESTQWQAERNATKPQMVELKPEDPTSLLEADSCYRIICTTDVKGETTGPLPDLGHEHYPDVGVMGIFRTKKSE